MTEQAQQILNDMIETTTDRINKFMEDEKFLNERVDFIIDLTKKTGREEMKRGKEEMNPDLTAEEQQKIVEEEKEKFITEAAMQQIQVLKPVIDEMAEVRYEFTKKLAELSKEDFLEVNYRAIEEETKLNVKFQTLLTRMAQPRLFKALEELDDEFDKMLDEEEKESNLRYVGPDELIN